MTISIFKIYSLISFSSLGSYCEEIIKEIYIIKIFPTVFYIYNWLNCEKNKYRQNKFTWDDFTMILAVFAAIPDKAAKFLQYIKETELDGFLHLHLTYKLEIRNSK